MEVGGKRAEYVSEPCDLCLMEGLSTQAVGYCNECDERMCSKCFQHHIKSKLSRNHVLRPLGQSSLHGKKQTVSNEKCKIHVKEDVNYYCRKHDMVTCGDCNVAEHSECKMEFISNLAKQFENSSELKEIIRKIENLEAEQKENKIQLDNNRKEIKRCLDTALADIKTFRKDLNEHLDKLEKEILFEANKMAKQSDDILGQLEEVLSLAEKDICDIRKDLDANMTLGDTLFIRMKENKQKLRKVDESVSLIKTKNVIKGVRFEPEKQLLDMVMSDVKLGCLGRDTDTQKEASVIQKTKQPIETVNTGTTSVAADKQLEGTEKTPTIIQKNSQSVETVKPELHVRAKKNVQSLFPPEETPTVTQKNRQSVKPELPVRANKNVHIQCFSAPAEEAYTAMQKNRQSVKPELPVRANKNVQSISLPDPRTAGFDVGSRVERDYLAPDSDRPETGTVTWVYPDGYVDVQWECGLSSTRIVAGEGGTFDVRLAH